MEPLVRQSSAPSSTVADGVSRAPTAGDEARRQMAATERRFGAAPIGSKVKAEAQALRRQRSADDSFAARYTQSQASKAVRPAFFCSRGQRRNRNRVTLDTYKAVQLKQLNTFREQAKDGRWASIHHAHFDWCVPLRFRFASPPSRAHRLPVIAAVAFYKTFPQVLLSH